MEITEEIGASELCGSGTGTAAAGRLAALSARCWPGKKRRGTTGEMPVPSSHHFFWRFPKKGVKLKAVFYIAGVDKFWIYSR